MKLDSQLQPGQGQEPGKPGATRTQGVGSKMGQSLPPRQGRGDEGYSQAPWGDMRAGDLPRGLGGSFLGWPGSSGHPLQSSPKGPRMPLSGQTLRPRTLAQLSPLTAADVGRVKRVVRRAVEAWQAALTVDAGGVVLGVQGPLSPGRSLPRLRASPSPAL